MKVKNIPIGQIIREELRRQNKTNRWFAEQINVNPRTINKIFLKDIIDTHQLFLISKALGVDFFKFYSEAFERAMIEQSEESNS